MGESKSSADLKALPEIATEMPPEAEREGSASLNDADDTNADEELETPV